ncbi:MAG: stearoyl-CoA desaturase (delta-9 desaturase) [Flavobacteriales bacterium]|jgi:stearoyl-CoA desaturase (delta-9 desaturase)
MEILLFLIIHWYLSLFCQTFFLHRYSAHAMFSMSKGWEKFFFILSWISQGSSYLSAHAYGILHRMHHEYADTEKDPHSPKYDPTLMKMMWRTKQVYMDIMNDETGIDERFRINVPEWRSFDLFASAYYCRLSWAAVYIAFYVIYAENWWMYLLLPIHFLMGPLHGAVINWFAHKYGYTNFKVSNTSKNFLPVDILMMGESYHNNHHAQADDPNFGHRWFEIDPSYPIILLLNTFGVIKLKKK